MLCYSFNSFMSHVLLSSNINIYNGCAPQLIHDVDLTTVSFIYIYIYIYICR